ncbi:MAG: hypothetical protein LBG19_08495 [Prevotellaceae bacterium]|jgi:hypothetical protein|nr:hypothetical protein [Prevotellaceae bacterium]
MKIIKSIFSLTLILLVLSVNTKLYAATEGKDSFEKNFGIGSAKMLVLVGHNSNVEILTGDNDEIKVWGEITHGEGSDEDIKNLVSAFKNIESKRSGNTANINLNHFIKSSVTNGKNTITLASGEKISIKNATISTSYKIWIPKNFNIELNHTYGSVNVADIDGNLTLNLYSTKFTTGNFGSTGKFDMKYSRGSIGSGGNSTFKLYSCDLVNIKGLKNVSIDSKYSKLNIQSAQSVKIDSYSDKLLFEQAASFTFNAKYSELRINSNIGSFTTNLYSSKIWAKDMSEVKFDAKYSEFRADNISGLAISSSYSNKYMVGTIATLSCTDSKYDDFKLSILTTSCNMRKAYSTKLNIEGTSASFSKFYGDFTYGSVYLKLHKDSGGINLKYNAKNGKTYKPRSWHYSKIDRSKDGSTIDFEGKTTPNAKATIEFTSYGADINIEE